MVSFHFGWGQVIFISHKERQQEVCAKLGEPGLQESLTNAVTNLKAALAEKIRRGFELQYLAEAYMAQRNRDFGREASALEQLRKMGGLALEYLPILQTAAETPELVSQRK